MQAFSNQTGKHLFDAHGREVPPGRIIGVERLMLAAEARSMEPDTSTVDPTSSQSEATTEKPAEAKQRKPGG